MKNTIAIMGATGHIGMILTEELLKKGHKVHAIGRDKEKLQKLKEKGAQIFISSFEDANALTEAFKGCNAVFSFIPPAMDVEDFTAYQDKVGEAIKKAIMNNKITHVINLSSIGAELDTGTGPIKGLHRHEKRLNEIPQINVLHFRAGFFMENLMRAIPLIKGMGIIGTPIKSDLQIPMIATRDIGKKIAEQFDTLSFKGQTIFDFIGPKAITMTEASTIIAKSIGKPDLKYIQFAYEDAERGMIGMGMQPKSAKMMIEMHKAFNEGKIHTTQQIKSDNHGSTTIDEFGKIFAQKFRMETPEHAARH